MFDLLFPLYVVLVDLVGFVFLFDWALVSDVV